MSRHSLCQMLEVWESGGSLGSERSGGRWEEGNLTSPWIPRPMREKQTRCLEEAQPFQRPRAGQVPRGKVCPVPFFALVSGASIPLGPTDHDPGRLNPGSESTAIKDPGGWTGGLGSAPSIPGLGRITHPSPSLNTASARNSRSREGARRPRAGTWVGPPTVEGAVSQ